MAALENDRPPLACVHAVGVLKNITHHIIARVVFIATCRLPLLAPTRISARFTRLLPSIPVSLSLYLSPSRQRGSGKMRNDRARFEERGPCLKFMNDFTALLSPQKGYIERERERECVAHISKRSALDKNRGKEREREGEVCSNPTKYINCRIFRASCISVRAPLCPLPATDLLIINYPDNELSHPPLSSSSLAAASFRRFHHSLSFYFIFIYFYFVFLYIYLIFIQRRRFVFMEKRNECPPLSSLTRGRGGLVNYRPEFRAASEFVGF